MEIEIISLRDTKEILLREYNNWEERYEKVPRRWQVIVQIPAIILALPKTYIYEGYIMDIMPFFEDDKIEFDIAFKATNAFSGDIGENLSLDTKDYAYAWGLRYC